MKHEIFEIKHELNSRQTLRHNDNFVLKYLQQSRNTEM